MTARSSSARTRIGAELRRAVSGDSRASLSEHPRQRITSACAPDPAADPDPGHASCVDAAVGKECHSRRLPPFVSPIPRWRESIPLDHPSQPLRPAACRLAHLRQRVVADAASRRLPLSCPRPPRIPVHAIDRDRRRILSRRSSKIMLKRCSRSTTSASSRPTDRFTRASGSFSSRSRAVVTCTSVFSGCVVPTAGTRNYCRSPEKREISVRVADRNAPLPGQSAWSRKSCRTFLTCKWF